MRKEHRTRVVQKDGRVQRPRRGHAQGRVRLDKVTRAWSRKDVQFETSALPRVWMGIYRRAGARPRVTRTTTSVAQRRLKEGEPAGCAVDRGRDAGRAWREARIRVGRAQSRSFRGREGRAVDERGQRTIRWAQPGVRPARLPYYDGLYRLFQGKGGGETEARTWSRGSTGSSRAEGRARWTGRGRPRRGRKGSVAQR